MEPVMFFITFMTIAFGTVGVIVSACMVWVIIRPQKTQPKPEAEVPVEEMLVALINAWGGIQICDNRCPQFVGTEDRDQRPQLYTRKTLRQVIQAAYDSLDLEARNSRSGNL